MRHLVRVSKAAELYLRWLVAGLMFAMMGVTVLDVVARKLGYSFPASFEVTQILIGITFYVSLPLATARRSHIVVDLVPMSASRAYGRLTLICVDLLSSFAIGWVSAMLLRQARTLDQFHTVLQFTRVPLSPFVTAMSVLAAATALVCLGQAILRVRDWRRAI